MLLVMEMPEGTRVEGWKVESERLKGGLLLSLNMDYATNTGWFRSGKNRR